MIVFLMHCYSYAYGKHRKRVPTPNRVFISSFQVGLFQSPSHTSFIHLLFIKFTDHRLLHRNTEEACVCMEYLHFPKNLFILGLACSFKKHNSKTENWFLHYLFLIKTLQELAKKPSNPKTKPLEKSWFAVACHINWFVGRMRWLSNGSQEFAINFLDYSAFFLEV